MYVVYGNNKDYYVHNKPGNYRDKTMADKLMYILNDDTQNNPLCRLQLVVETFRHYFMIKPTKIPVNE